MKTNDKLSQRRKQLGLTLEDVGQIVGVGKSTVRKWETGDIANMKRDKIALLAKALKVSPSFIMGIEEIPSSSNIISLDEIPRLPVVGKIAAGAPVLAEENIIGWEYVPDLKNAKDCFCLLVKGDSMINAGILDGSKVVIRQQNTAEDGQIVACLVNGDEATLKRFKQVEDKVILMPENSNYQPLIVSCNDFENGYARIIGVAVMVVTSKML